MHERGHGTFVFISLLAAVSLAWAAAAAELQHEVAPGSDAAGSGPGAKLAGSPYRDGPWRQLGGAATGTALSGTVRSAPNDVAVSPDGRPHVLWDAWDPPVPGLPRSTQVQLAVWDGQRWSGLGGSERGKGLSASSQRGSTYSRLALGPEGWPHAAWIDNDGYDAVVHAWWDGLSWRRERFVIGHDSGSKVDVAVNARGRVFIAALEPCGDTGARRCRVVACHVRDGRGWRRLLGADGEDIASSDEGCGQEGIRIALDPLGRPHLVWKCGAHVQHAFWNGRDWQRLGERTEGVDANPARCSQPTLAVDAQGVPHVAWRQEVGERYEIYYRRWLGDRWVGLGGSDHGGGVSRLGANAFTPALVLDSLSRPHLAWGQGMESRSPMPTEACYRFWDGSAWAEVEGSGSPSGVTATGGYSRHVELAIGGDDSVHLVWGEIVEEPRVTVRHLFLPPANRR